MASSPAGSRRMRPEHAVSDAHVLVAPARASAGSGRRWRQRRRWRPRMDVATSGCRRGGIGGGSRPTSSPRSPDSAAGCDALMALLCASLLWVRTCLAVLISGPSELAHAATDERSPQNGRTGGSCATPAPGAEATSSGGHLAISAQAAVARGQPPGPTADRVRGELRVLVRSRGQRGRLGGATAGHHGLLGLHLKA